MKITALGDIHMATSALCEIDTLNTADLVIMTGDITNFGNRLDAKVVLNEILSINNNLLCLAGNLDNEDVNDYLDDLDMNLHGQAHFLHREVCLYGVGGSNRTPFGTPWEFSENELTTIVHEAYQQARELIELAVPFVGHSIPTILVSHAPPYGTLIDKLRNGRHVGSKAIRNFIETNKPDFCLSGHIHEAQGTDRIGDTQVVNLGMLLEGGWCSLKVENNSITLQK